MEGIDLLQNLNEQKKALFKAVKAQEEALDEKLFTFFKTISEYDGLEMMPLQCTIRRPWSLAERNNIFEVQLTIRFYDETGAKWPSGQPRSDFGSDILFYIYDDHIKMNYGNCGEYTNKNKGQMTRAFLIPKLWENEDTICSIAKASININDYDELQEVRMKIDRINDDIKKAERERKRKEVLLKILSAKFICKRRKHEIYHYDEEAHKYITDGYEWIYYDHEQINKVTDKNVLTTDLYWHDNHRRDLNQIISDVAGGYLFLQDEKIDKEPIPEEVPAKQAGAPSPPRKKVYIMKRYYELCITHIDGINQDMLNLEYAEDILRETF